MNKYLKEIIIVLLQVITFYTLPLYPHEYQVMGLVLLMIFITFVLSLVMSLISNKKIKYLYPVIVSVLFIPSILIYYNESALIYTVWYLITSATGIVIGIIIKEIYETRRSNKHHK